MILPSSLSPAVKRFPAAIAMISCQSETSHCPKTLLPTAITVPSDLSPTVCPTPVDIATISRQSETSHSLEGQDLPTTMTVPSDLSPTV